MLILVGNCLALNAALQKMAKAFSDSEMTIQGHKNSNTFILLQFCHWSDLRFFRRDLNRPPKEISGGQGVNASL